MFQFRDWNPKQIAQYCRDHNHDELAEKLENEEIDGSAIEFLTEEELKDLFPTVGRRKKFKLLLAELTQQLETATVTYTVIFPLCRQIRYAACRNTVLNLT